MINNNLSKVNLSFSGRRIYEKYRTLEGPFCEKTTPQEDEADLTEILNRLKVTKQFKKDKASGFKLPSVITDEYKITTPSEGVDICTLNITNKSNSITRVFSADAQTHEARAVFKECIAFLRKIYTK